MHMRPLIVVLLITVFACQNKPQEPPSPTFGSDVEIARLSWEDCYSLVVPVERDRTEYVENLQALFDMLYQSSEFYFSAEGVCKVFYKLKDSKGLWFVAMVERESFRGSSPSKLPSVIHELSFSEDMRKYACDFYRENYGEKAFLVCTRYTELKKLYSND